MRSGELERSARLGEYFFQVGRKSLGHHPSVGDVRGKGLVMGIELVRNKRTKEPCDPKLKAGNRFQQIAMSHGCMVYATFGVDHGTRGDHYLVTSSMKNRSMRLSRCWTQRRPTSKGSSSLN
ncbi:MAG: hypothetical protein E4G93_01805 [Dehalococcoidia bacterium]|nr:MAG: hypothetical protein E4G93_01805 [Dehalococcoidia bacterium]